MSRRSLSITETNVTRRRCIMIIKLAPWFFCGMVGTVVLFYSQTLYSDSDDFLLSYATAAEEATIQAVKETASLLSSFSLMESANVSAVSAMSMGATELLKQQAHQEQNYSSPQNSVPSQTLVVSHHIEPQYYKFGSDPIPVPMPPFDSFWSWTINQAQNASQIPQVFHRIQRNEYDVNTNNSFFPIPVLFWPQYRMGIQTAEHLHLAQNGVNESRFLRWVDNISDFSDPNLIWIADPGKGWSWTTWCDALVNATKVTIIDRYRAGYNTRWPIFIIDFSDGSGRQRCVGVETLVGAELVTYSARSIAKGRTYDSKHNWIRAGHTVKSPDEYVYLKSVPKSVRHEKNYQHTPLIVRTDIVERIESVLGRLHGGKKLSDPIEELPRPIDVTHVWPLNFTMSFTKTKSSPVIQQHALFRHRVSQVIHEFGLKHGWKTSIEPKGDGARSGRRGTKAVYIEGMLETKILVVSQRDHWEDHYRLFEALVSGSCVFSDFMHGLPVGLQNGTSLILYTSAEDLENQILYYLSHDDERIAMAKKGREIAMSRHRSWHRIEEVIFGKPLSNCSVLAGKNMKDTKCPFIVHTYEA